MPAVYNATFRVRHYECDAHGHLNNANYVRYMQEAAFEASASVGYPKERYEAMGYLWLAHETEIEYLQPVVYGDTIVVKTWVGDFRRVRSRRFYEFRKAGETELVARASTDWVYLEAATERPSAVPPEMIAAFAPEGDVEIAPPRPRFPAFPNPPPGVFTIRRRVEWRDIDTARHVNNAVYFNYIEECALEVAEAHGWPLARSEAAGFAAIARAHHIEYRQPAFLGDTLEIATWAAPEGRASANRFYTVSRAGTLLAKARTRWVWIDVKTRRPIRIPSNYAADFARNMAVEETS
jgi:acyl-CoA thioester hydrolase